MTPVTSTSAPASRLMAGSIPQRLRILSGLILFAFVLTHLLNHAFGLWSLEAMEVVQKWRTGVTQSVLGQLVLGAALLTHLVLNLYKLARRSTWRMSFWEAAQIGLGLAIPFLLFPHAAGMIGLRATTELETLYSDRLPDLWESPVRQTVFVLIAWVHGCIGLHYWLRLTRSYASMAPFILAVAVLVPAMALAGFSVAGRDATEQITEQTAAAPPASVASAYAAAQASEETVEVLQTYATGVALFLLLALVLAIVGGMWLRARRRSIRVSYTAGPVVPATIGSTLLEISRMNNVPHTAVCGGRARCSTCRVRVETTAAVLPLRTSAEAATLKRIHAASDVRLACQLRPEGDLTVTRLVQPPQAERVPSLVDPDEAGVERTLAVLFLDIRGFTALSEARLPYDTVFLLNRFFTETGGVTKAAGGWIDKYMGDGLMALFGMNQTSAEACRGAMSAAVAIDAALDHLNNELKGEIAAPLRIGMGLHVGPLVIGRIGHPASATTTVIGPAVNVASRLENLTKEHGVQIIASRTLCELAGVPPGAFGEMDVAVRGASAVLSVTLIPRGRDLQNILDAGMRPAAA